MKLQDEHLEAIDTIYGVFKTDYSMALSSQCSAQITKDYMKRFAEWLISNGYILQDNGRLFKETQSDLSKDYSFNELIEIFLETEK